MGAQVSFAAYGRESLEALRAVVAEAKTDDPMAPVTVLVPNNIAGIVARRHLARGLSEGTKGVAGIWFTTLPRLAEQLAAPTLTGEGRRPATRPVTAAAIRAALDAEPGGFDRVAEHPATTRALARAHHTLRDVDHAALSGLEEASPLVSDVVRLHRETTQRLSGSWYDTTDLLHAATQLMTETPTRANELGLVVLYLPQDLSRAETAFAEALAGATDMRIIAALTGAARVDAAVHATVQSLAPTTELPPAAQHKGAQRVLAASDSDDEVRCVVREVVRTLREVPAHRVAVLYAERSPYARLLHEHFTAADITVNGPGVRPVNERALSRLVLGLLETARTGFRRADVLRVLGEVGTRAFDGERISVSRWERVSREAGVVAGWDWDCRLTAYLEHQEEEAKKAEYESTRERAIRNRDTAESLHDFMTELQSRFSDAAALSTWQELGAWTLGLFHNLVPPSNHHRFPLEEQYAAGVLERTLRGLTALDASGLPPALDTLEEALSVELESALPRVGRFGEGVLVAPITHAIGLDLDIVFLVGLSEDLFPGRLHDDSLLSERARAHALGQLPSTRASMDREHRSLLAAFASAAHVTVSFPRGDLRRHTHRLPSRWLLSTLRRLSGDPNLPATEWEKGTERAGDWLRSSPSYAGGLLTTDAPSCEQEWRVRAASAGQQLDDATVDAAREMRRARESAEFTRFDGNLTGQEGLPDFGGGERFVSTTALEHYAICPHQYFVERLLGVAPVEAPEETIEISPMDVGNLVHESFDALVREAASRRELPDYGQPWTDAQRQRLRELANAKADEYEAQGRTGHPLLWQRHRAQILGVLEWMVDEDNRWRAEQDAKVVASELPFGLKAEEPVKLPLGEGRTVRFRGAADKVDQRRDGTLLVTDIKTGSQRKFKGLSEDDPVGGGEKLQLPVYAMAARAAHGDVDTPVEAMYWFVRRDRGRIQLPLTDAVRSAYATTVRLLVESMARGAFPQRAPKDPDFKWVQCPFCNPDGLGHGAVRERWEAKRLAPELMEYTALVEPHAVPHGGGSEGQAESDDDGGPQ